MVEHAGEPHAGQARAAAARPGANADAPGPEGRQTLNALDAGYAPARWAFDDEVTRVFDDMLRRSIPDYDAMRRLVFEVGCRHVRPGLAVVDLGCSRGDALEPFIQRFGAHNHFVGVEASAPMAAAARDRFRGLIDAGVVRVEQRDLRSWYPPWRACLTLCVLTLQFVPVEYRQGLLRNAFAHTAPGGALVLVEKVLGASAPADDLLRDLYHQAKRESGYSQEDIDRKRLALEGVMVPMAARHDEDLLHAAGFPHVECFWRHLCFAGWVALKPELPL